MSVLSGIAKVSEVAEERSEVLVAERLDLINPDKPLFDINNFRSFVTHPVLWTMVFDAFEEYGFKTEDVTVEVMPVNEYAKVKFISNVEGAKFVSERTFHLDKVTAEDIHSAALHFVTDIVRNVELQGVVDSLNAVYASALEAGSAGYKVSFVRGNYSNSRVIQYISDSSIVLKLNDEDVDKASELLLLKPVIPGEDETARTKAFDALTAGILKHVTAVSYFASKPDVIQYFYNISARASLVKIIESAISIKVESKVKASKKKGVAPKPYVGYIKDGDVFGAVEWDGTQFIEHISARNSKTLEPVDNGVTSVDLANALAG